MPAPPRSLLPPQHPTSSSCGVPYGLAVQPLARLHLRARGRRSFPLSASASSLRPNSGPGPTPTILQGPELTQEPGRTPAFSVFPQPVSSWDPALTSGRPKAHGPRVTSWLTFGVVVDELLAARVPGEQQGRGLGAKVQQRQQEALVPGAGQPRCPCHGSSHSSSFLVDVLRKRGPRRTSLVSVREMGCHHSHRGCPCRAPKTPSGCGDGVCVNTGARVPGDQRAEGGGSEAPRPPSWPGAEPGAGGPGSWTSRQHAPRQAPWPAPQPSRRPVPESFLSSSGWCPGSGPACTTLRSSRRLSLGSEGCSS